MKGGSAVAKVYLHFQIKVQPEFTALQKEKAIRTNN